MFISKLNVHEKHISIIIAKLSTINTLSNRLTQYNVQNESIHKNNWKDVKIIDN